MSEFQPFAHLEHWYDLDVLEELFDDYFLETSSESLQRPDAATEISIWIEEYDHGPDDSFCVMGQYKGSDDDFAISDLHCKEGADDYIRKLKSYLVFSGVSWQFKEANPQGA